MQKSTQNYLHIDYSILYLPSILIEIWIYIK